MVEGSIVCARCQLNEICHPRLEPEYVETDILGRAKIRQLTKGRSVYCRHLSCVDGQAAAWDALQDCEINDTSFMAYVTYTSGGRHLQRVVSFGSKDKHDVKGIGRVVNFRGRIFSMNAVDQNYYDTGMYAKPYREP